MHATRTIEIHFLRGTGLLDNESPHTVEHLQISHNEVHFFLLFTYPVLLLAITQAQALCIVIIVFVLIIVLIIIVIIISASPS